MTRSERLQELGFTLGGAEAMAYDAARHFPFDISVDEFSSAASYANKALDHLAALEQSAIDAYLAEVPLPAGWTEKDYGDGFRYWQVVDGIDVPVERVLTTSRTVSITPLPRDWPPIPLPVLLRAAVQCHRLREAKA